MTLSDIESLAVSRAVALGLQVETFQSNHEGAIVDRIQEEAYCGPERMVGGKGKGKALAIIINPGALTHTSVAVRDALLAVDVPFIEVHLTNIHARETWRCQSYLTDKATAVICGLGAYGYEAALEYVARHLRAKKARL